MQPAELVPVTVYVPAEVNEPVADVPPLLHKYEPPAPAPDAVDVTVDPQVDSRDEEETVTVGLLFTVTLVGEEVAEQLVGNVTVQVYCPPELAVIEWLVEEPMFQEYVAPAAEGTDKPTLCPEQKVVGPLALIVASGRAFTVTVADPV